MDAPPAASSEVEPVPHDPKRLAFQDYHYKLHHMQPGNWKLESPPADPLGPLPPASAKVRAKARDTWEEEAYARQERARDRSIEEWASILELQELPAEARTYLARVYEQHGNYLESRWYYPEDPKDQKTMYDYPNGQAMLGLLAVFSGSGQRR